PGVELKQLVILLPPAMKMPGLLILQIVLNSVSLKLFDSVGNAAWVLRHALLVLLFGVQVIASIEALFRVFFPVFSVHHFASFASAASAASRVRKTVLPTSSAAAMVKKHSNTPPSTIQ